MFAEKNSWGRAFDSHQVLGFFLLFQFLNSASLFRSLKEMQHYWFSFAKNRCLAVQLGTKQAQYAQIWRKISTRVVATFLRGQKFLATPSGHKIVCLPTVVYETMFLYSKLFYVYSGRWANDWSCFGWKNLGGWTRRLIEIVAVEIIDSYLKQAIMVCQQLSMKWYTLHFYWLILNWLYEVWLKSDTCLSKALNYEFLSISYVSSKPLFDFKPFL